MVLLFGSFFPPSFCLLSSRPAFHTRVRQVLEHSYIFTSERLGFRLWQDADLSAMAALNADDRVMAFFPQKISRTDTQAFMERMQRQYEQKNFCYFAVDRLDTSAFIGFIGLSQQDFEADFTPCVDIGWRLAGQHWGQGFATEGAGRCLVYAFQKLNLKEVYAFCPQANTPSIHVMRKLGMQQQGEFLHPMLKDSPELQPCVYYKTDQTAGIERKIIKADG